MLGERRRGREEEEREGDFFFVFTGFRGRSKPNLLRQETSSILTAIRILYWMLGDETRRDNYSEIENRLLG